MTKLQIIHSFLNDERTGKILAELSELVRQDRITTGAAYYVFCPYETYGYKRISEILDRAFKSKNYTQYVNCSIPKRDLVYYYNEYLADLDRAEKFIEEQKGLPFEDTLKQVLKREGELH